MKQLLLSLSICLATSLSAEMPRPDGMAFFKQSVGTWKGKGTSLIGPNKPKLEVTDDWKGELTPDGTAFVQLGKVTLSNGASFEYRWVYKVDPKSEKLMALYTDSQKTRSVFSVQLAEDQSKLKVTPVEPTGGPSKGGLYSTLYFKDGRLIYDAEVRDGEGKAVVQTTVTSVKQEEKPATSP